MMRRFGMLILFLAIPVLAVQAPPQDPANGSIEGIVVNRVNGQPVAGVRVQTRPTAGNPNQTYAPIEPIITGVDGKFVFTSLKGAVYRVLAEGNGYVAQFNGQNSFQGEGTTFALATSQAVKGITVRLTPTGTVTGRIRDAETQQPAVSVPVQLMRLQYGAEGQRALVSQQGAARTDDRGEYRFYFVTPGHYYITVGGAFPQESGVRGLNNSNEIRVDYASEFYPGVVNISDATLVDVKSGAELGGIDVSIGKQVLYQIRGRVLDSKTGRPPISATVSLFRRSDTRWERVQVSNNYRSTDGSFTIPGLVPGSYRVVVQARTTRGLAQSSPPLPAMARLASFPVQFAASRTEDASGYAPKVTPVEVVSSDVDGLVVSVLPGVSLAGRLTIEGQGLPSSDLSRIRVVITSPDKLISANALVTQEAFRLGDLSTGEYRASVGGLPAGYYVKSARFGGADALQNVFQIADGEVNALNVVISSNVATVEGTVKNERQQPVLGSLVVLVPERDRDRTELFQRATAGADGRFSFPSVPPGNYKVFAWEALEPYAYFDPEVLRVVEQRGRAIQLAESSKQILNLIAIPANN